ncbi:DNA polymerase IV [Desulfovibrio inopinatus]|uniref:DNA polymerase IV n=1 Tax=Desulfovibrio inopinatus TaxID=102109 RepID=UPI00040D3B32|nr:DNA polymerase IV [Desulfovibrio inopinatus]
MIFHIDMDAFFASVEQLDNPELRGLPVIIGKGTRGVVSAASYEARWFGVHSAMPVMQARKLCPHGIFLSGRMHRYAEISRQVMALFEEIAPVVEPASIDEAYLDVAGLGRLYGPPLEIAVMIQQRVREEIDLSCAIGGAPVKFLAKIASDMKKPGGITIIEEHDVSEVLRTLPIGKIPGVGGRTATTLARLGIVHAGDMARQSDAFWERHLGKWGLELAKKARGEDRSRVNPSRERKSVSAEHTLSRDTADRDVLCTHLLTQAERVGHGLRRRGFAGRTVTLKLKFADFTNLTRSETVSHPLCATDTIYSTAKSLFDKIELSRPVRLIGVGVSNFNGPAQQLTLLPDERQSRHDRLVQLDHAVDAIQEKYGRDIMGRARAKNRSDSE